MKYVLLTTMMCAGMLIFSTASGCTKKKTSADLIHNNLDRLAACYRVFWSEHEHRGPEDEAELKSFLRESRSAQKRLKRMGISTDQVDSMFTSDRDGEKFKVKYGVQGYFDHATIFESKGIDGKRMIALMTPIEADDATYDGHWSGDIKPRSLKTFMGGGNEEKAEAETVAAEQ